MRHLNKAGKERLMQMAAVSGAMETLATNMRLEGADKSLMDCVKLAEAAAQKYVNRVMASLSAVEQKRTIDDCGKMTIVTRPTEEAVRELEKLHKLTTYTTMPNDEYLILTEQVIRICQLCNRQGERVEGCRIKDILIRTDVEPLEPDAPEGNCPYRKRQQKFSPRTLRYMRHKLKLTQVELAEKVGVDNTLISAIELGKRMCSDALQQKLAQALGVTLDELEEWGDGGACEGEEKPVGQGAADLCGVCNP